MQMQDFGLFETVAVVSIFGFTISRELGKGMIWICRCIEIGQVTTCTVGGCPSGITIGMAKRAGHRGMCASEWKDRRDVVVKG